MQRLLLILAQMLLASAAPAQMLPKSPTLLQILVAPDQYHGRQVQVLGYCRLEFEGFAIYLSKEDYTYGLGNMVWLKFEKDEDITPQRRKIEYCLVQGTYNAKDRGHMGLFIGAIENIKRYEPWPPYPVKRPK